MPSEREWPFERIQVLLDYIDNFGHTLAKSGPRRADGYEKLQKYLSAHVPREQACDTDDIRKQCSFLHTQYSRYNGASLTVLFKEGRKSLQPPYGPASSDVEHAESESTTTIATDTGNNLTSLQDLPRPPLHPRSRPRYTQSPEINPPKRKAPRNIRRSRIAPQPCKIPKSSLGNGEGTPPRQMIYQSDWWRDLVYLRSEKCRISLQDISPAMTRLKRNAERAADSYLENCDGDFPRSNLGYIRQMLEQG